MMNLQLYLLENICYSSEAPIFARVVELVDTLALGASAFGRGGSSPLSRTM